MTYDFAIVGGGIVGLSTAMALTDRFPHARIILLEKEAEFALHQTGRNSGVIHSGIYYKPGSFKAHFCREGNETMVAFCRQHGLPYDICGKVIVATNSSEVPALERLHARAVENGLPVTRLSPEQLREREPHVASVASILLPSTGITNFRAVSLKYAEIAAVRGATLMLKHARDGHAYLAGCPGDRNDKGRNRNPFPHQLRRTSERSAGTDVRI